ncbi:FAD/NAD(P)-binding protein [Aspergillus alliaceus]|uniref:FAD/NAD(P)-binding protein n=1 Tax=Petromyces alliaceus TaxID=209559 RepID=UPI0012A47667|nr:FAD-NAD(P)-binding-domain-containing protein [Aspergillus alliaceus]KAB8237603.1 FAD-NAD(P)-binding-domain-containing protein [Aspergillus alliaceus]
MHPNMVDVSIIGSGTSAVAIAAQVVNKSISNEKVRSIVLIEKGEHPGTGLAYSKACEGTFVNGHPSTMGVFARDPEGFLRWMSEQGQEYRGSPPTRERFGEYLQDQLAQTVHAADKLGIEVRIIKDETVDVVDLDGRYEVILKDSSPIVSRQVVLAIGDFPKQIYSKMSHFPGYLGAPWPLQKLNRISPDATVAVVGTSLTAVDIALRLAENGHRGKICLFSRNGRLPKVKGPSPALAVFRNQHILHKLARDLEQNPHNAFETIITTMAAELEKINWLHRFSMKQLNGPKSELEADIAAAENGHMEWLAVLHATGTVLERYWNALSLEERTTFNEKYASVWYLYRNAMPLHNGKQLHALMLAGQLQVLSKPTVSWDGDYFVVKSGEETIQSSFLVEACGLEHNPYAIESPLLHRLMDSKLLRPHEAGGVSVDFWTLEATKNFHVIGSLTRGVHFYTNSVRRIAAHAERVADTIIGNRVCRPQHVALFIGSLNAYLNVLPKLIPRLLDNNHVPFVFVTASVVKSLSAIERYLNGSGPQVALPDLQSRYGVFTMEIDSSGPSLLKALKSSHIDVGLGVDIEKVQPSEASHYFQSPREFVRFFDRHAEALNGKCMEPHSDSARVVEDMVNAVDCLGRRKPITA